MLHPVYGMRSQGIETDYRADWAATGVNEFLENYADGRETYLSGIRSFAQTIYGRVLNLSHKRYFLDKTPRYSMIVPELVELFPKAKYILLIRNPLAVLKSELDTYIGNEYWRLADFNPDLLDAPRRLIEARKICGDRGITVHYESLVTEPDDTIQQICRHLDIEFKANMLEYGDRPAPLGRMNDPVGIHQHSRPNVSGMDKWRKLGHNTQHRHFALSYLDELGTETITALGYDPQSLRSELEIMRIENRISPVYSWNLATTPRSRHTFRDRLTAAYCITAQQHGSMTGIFASLALVANRIIGPVRRLFRKSDTRFRQKNKK